MKLYLCPNCEQQFGVHARPYFCPYCGQRLGREQSLIRVEISTDTAAIRQGVKAFKEGRVKPWNQVKKELGELRL